MDPDIEALRAAGYVIHDADLDAFDNRAMAETWGIDAYPSLMAIHSRTHVHIRTDVGCRRRADIETWIRKWAPNVVPTPPPAPPKPPAPPPSPTPTVTAATVGVTLTVKAAGRIVVKHADGTTGYLDCGVGDTVTIGG
jgi:hypothetical protein